MSTTTNFYPSAGDGFVVGPQGATWAATRDAANGAGAGATGTDTNEGTFGGSPCLGTYGGNKYGLARAFVPFDTSAIGAGSTIISATLNLCVAYKNRDAFYANQNVDVTESTVVSTITLATTDFALWNNTRLVTGIAHDSLAAVGSYSSWTLTADGLAAISKTAYSKYCVRYANDVDNADPGLGLAGNDITFGFRTSEYAGTTSDPYLAVTYENGTTTRHRGPSGGVAIGSPMMY